MKRLNLLLSLALVTIFIIVAATGSGVEAQESSAGVPSGKIVDLSYAFDAATVYWPTAEQFQLQKDFERSEERRVGKECRL